MRITVKRLAIGTTLVATIALGGTVSLFYAAQQQPAFYQEAMKVDPAGQQPAGEALERGVVELHNQTRSPGQWESRFSESAINGWLASDLPEKFPGMLPKGVKNPRVAIRDGVIHVAAQYVDGLMTYVVSFTVDVDLTDEPNTVAVTVGRVRAGSLPVPVRQFLDRISTAAHRGNIPLRWGESSGDPVAFVTIPSRHKDYVQQEIVVERIELREGEVFLAGRTDAVRKSTTGDIAQRIPVESSFENSAVQR